jgi:hypothetical protein
MAKSAYLVCAVKTPVCRSFLCTVENSVCPALETISLCSAAALCALCKIYLCTVAALYKNLSVLLVHCVKKVSPGGTPCGSVCPVGTCQNLYVLLLHCVAKSVRSVFALRKKIYLCTGLKHFILFVPGIKNLSALLVTVLKLLFFKLERKQYRYLSILFVYSTLQKSVI